MSIFSTLLSKSKAEEIEILHKEVEMCRLCPIHKTGMGKCALYRGNPEAKILIVSEKSGPSEAEKGYPFAGASEKEIEYMLKACNLSWEKVIATNRVICNVEEPKNEHIKNCVWWKRVISISNPKMIIALGRLAVQSLRGKRISSVQEYIGHPFLYNGITIVPGFNPAYLLRLRESNIEEYKEQRKLIIDSIKETKAKLKLR